MKIRNLKGKEQGEVNLPAVFSGPVREDIVKRAFHSAMSHARQPYGAKPEAGNRHSTYLSKKRREYRGTYGIGQSRVPRKVMSSQGTQFQWMGAEVSGTVGGRRAHAPKAEKKWGQKINKKERKAAYASALCAIFSEHTSKKHATPKNYPFIITDDFATLTKTSDVQDALEALGFSEELQRTKEKRIRAGKGTARGRKYKKKVGPLIIAPEDATIHRAARNIPGVTTTTPQKVSILDLAPGAKPGRLTILTESAVKELGDQFE